VAWRSSNILIWLTKLLFTGFLDWCLLEGRYRHHLGM